MGDILALYGAYKTYINVTQQTLERFTIVNNVFTIPGGTSFNTCFGDPAPGVVKQLVIIINKRFTLINENDCSSNISIDTTTPLPHDCSYIRATYGTDSASLDVTQRLSETLVTPTTALHIPAGIVLNDLFSDPAPLQVKILRIQLANNHRLDIPEYRTDDITLYPFDIVTRKMYVYFHVGAVNNWFEVFVNAFNKIVISGLYDKLDEIRIGFLGKQSEQNRLQSFINSYPKARIKAASRSLDIYERLTLHMLREDSTKENFNVLYLHTKGVGHYGKKPYQFILDWINLMHHFLIGRHVHCLNTLNRLSVIGCKYNTSPQHHFSGNFWWATSSYIRTLSPTIGPAYVDPEMWILSGSCQFMEIHSGGESGYYKRYPESKYIHLPSMDIIRTK